MTRSVPENSPAETPVGDPVSATDEDIDDEGQLRYSLQGDRRSHVQHQSGNRADPGRWSPLRPRGRRASYEVTVKVIDNQTGSDTSGR